MMKSKCGIYYIKSKIDSKIYIGKSVNVSLRISSHRKLLKNNCHYNCHLQYSYNKNGKINFEYGVIEYCNIELLNEKEIYYISKFDACNDILGFNFKSGGEGGPHTIESKILMRSYKECKKVYGFSIDGILLKEWVSISNCAIELKANPCDVRRTINQVQRICKGYVLNDKPIFNLRESKRGVHLINLGIRKYMSQNVS